MHYLSSTFKASNDLIIPYVVLINSFIMSKTLVLTNTNEGGGSNVSAAL